MAVTIPTAGYNQFFSSIKQMMPDVPGLLNSLSDDYDGVTGLLNQDLSDKYKAYQEWGKRNREAMDQIPGLKQVGQAGDYLQDVMNTPGTEMMLPAAAPVGMIAKNFRSPEQLQQLRRLIAEENRARGPMGQVTNTHTTPFKPKDITTQFSDSELPGWLESWNRSGFDPYKTEIGQITDPFDQILRGSWYHGMSDAARGKIIGKSPEEIAIAKDWYRDMTLGKASEQGIPISMHDTQSISNKLGEPAGVSLSALPTKSQQFSADEYIHRVQPQYGGPPTERIVNLMKPEGRAVLNDAYDAAINPYISPEGLGRTVNNYADRIIDPTRNLDYKILDDVIGSHALDELHPGPFNKALSDQLQSSGYRGLLYNPHRWNEYEMLMLDPKYALPLDYRMFQEYANPVTMRANREMGFNGPLETRSATPSIREGLSQIQDIMSQNKSRLGDIYSERPWTERLSKENKQRLLELIDPQYREQVGNQLYNTR